MITSNKLYRLIVLGNTLEAWLAAAYIKRKMNHLVEITIVDNGQSNPIAQYINLGSTTHLFHKILGLTQNDMINFCEGKIHFGQSYYSIGDKSKSFFIPYSSSGFEKGFFHFHQLLSRINENFKNYNESYSINFALEKNNKVPSQSYRGPIPDYSFVVNSSRYHEKIKSIALSMGVQYIQSTNYQLKTDANGTINELTVDEEKIKNISHVINTLVNFDSQPNKKSSKASYRTVEIVNQESDYSDIALQWSLDEESIIKKQKLMGKQFIKGYHPIYLSMQQIEAIYSADNKTIAIIEDVISDTIEWSANKLNISLSNLETPPLVVCELEHFAASLADFIRLFTVEKNNTVNAKEFNRLVNQRQKSIDDLHHLILYQASSKLTPSTGVSSKIKKMIELYKTHGRFSLSPIEPVKAHYYFSVLIGNHLLPKSYHPLLDELDANQIKAEVKGLQNQIEIALQFTNNKGDLIPKR
ncbi:tryptophan 7-halogenase [Pleionea sediminis]|uniref:tryptophan 7-halogenase n=1 Tax=Pleionea sediminis TaxID=2569479 RepID=UPI0011862BE8|nr:tryptophan 7-halogenase [Pleionea sediminis]